VRFHNGETFGGFWALFSVFGCLAVVGGDEGRGDVEEVKGVREAGGGLSEVITRLG
jgi:hypothetical protein